MPPMSEERRKEMTKLARNEGESAKIAVRNLRRDANESVKKLVKDKLASEDDQKRAETDVQKFTDKHIAEIDALVAAKEQEIMAVLSVLCAFTYPRWPHTQVIARRSAQARPRPWQALQRRECLRVGPTLWESRGKARLRRCKPLAVFIPRRVLRLVAEPFPDFRGHLKVHHTL